MNQLAFTAAGATALYQPRLQDAPPALFAERLAVCETCDFRRAHRCTAHVPQQLFCSVLARPQDGFCPTGLWGTPPKTRLMPRRHPRGPGIADRLGPRPPATPLPICFAPLDRARLVRHLVCHIYPLAGGHWRRTVARLQAGGRHHQFNGRRLVSIAVGDGTDSASAVQDAFRAAGVDAEYFVTDNDPDLGEVKTFVPALEQIARPTPDTIVCYLQSKGATWPDPEACVHEWGDVMAAACLDQPELVARALDAAAIAGSFRHHEPTGITSGTWHYSGTFFWFRSDVIFSPMRARQWRCIDQTWVGVEGWPALHFPLAESACLFWDDCGAGGKTLYDPAYWQSTIRPAWERWQRAALAGASPGATPGTAP